MAARNWSFFVFFERYLRKYITIVVAIEDFRIEDFRTHEVDFILETCNYSEDYYF